MIIRSGCAKNAKRKIRGVDVRHNLYLKVFESGLTINKDDALYVKVGFDQEMPQEKMIEIWTNTGFAPKNLDSKYEIITEEEYRKNTDSDEYEDDDE